MTTLTKIIITTLLSLLFFSCNFDISLNPGINGNGNVVEETRTINGTFNGIEVSEGLDVSLTQSDNESILVEADENLHDLIITEVVNQVLKIHTKKNIGKATSKKVIVNFKHVSSITSTSGSDVYSTNTITTENLILESTSGSDMTIDVNSSNLSCKSSSGSDMQIQVSTKVLECNSSSGSGIKLTGNAIKLIAEASSGSSIIADDLFTESSEVNANSGSNITVNASKELVAKANSGGGISFYGNPEKVEKNGGVSGSIQKK